MTKRYTYLVGRLRQLGITQAELGRKLGGIPQTAISKRFNGRIPWTDVEMYQILDICGAPPEELSLYFPKAAKYLSGFIRCIMEGATA